MMDTRLRSHWVPLSYGLVPHLSKKLSKLPLVLGLLRPGLEVSMRVPSMGQIDLWKLFLFDLEY